MENRKIKKQKNKNSKKYVTIFFVIILTMLVVSFIIINKLNKEGANLKLASNLELSMLGKYVEKVDYNTIYQYENFDDSAKIDYAVKKYLEKNPDITELNAIEFVEFYENIFTDSSNIDSQKLSEQYFTILVSNGVIYNPSDLKFYVEKQEKNESQQPYFFKHIIEKAVKNGNMYTIYSKNIVTQYEEKLDEITLDNWDKYAINSFNEKLTIDLTDLNNFKIVDFSKVEVRKELNQ